MTSTQAIGNEIQGAQRSGLAPNWPGLSINPELEMNNHNINYSVDLGDEAIPSMPLAEGPHWDFAEGGPLRGANVSHQTRIQPFEPRKGSSLEQSGWGVGDQVLRENPSLQVQHSTPSNLGTVYPLVDLEIPYGRTLPQFDPRSTVDYSVMMRNVDAQRQERAAETESSNDFSDLLISVKWPPAISGGEANFISEPRDEHSRTFRNLQVDYSAANTMHDTTEGASQFDCESQRVAANPPKRKKPMAQSDESHRGSMNSENKRRKIELINAALEMAFELAPRPTNDEISRISRKVGLDLCKVQAWYQERMVWGATSVSHSSPMLPFDPIGTLDSAYETITDTFTSMSSQSLGGTGTGQYSSDYSTLPKRKVSKVLRYQCTWPGCFARFPNASEGGRHELKHYPKLWACIEPESSDARHLPKENKCPACKILLPNVRDLKKHDHLVCRNKPTLAKLFDRRYKLEEHLRQNHPRVVLPSDDSAAILEGWRRPGDIEFDPLCGYCSETMPSWNDRIKHIDNHYKLDPKLDISYWKYPEKEAPHQTFGSNDVFMLEGGEAIPSGLQSDSSNDSDTDDGDEQDIVFGSYQRPRGPDGDGDGFYGSGGSGGGMEPQQKKHRRNTENRKQGPEGRGNHSFQDQGRNTASHSSNWRQQIIERNFVRLSALFVFVKGLGSGSSGYIDEVLVKVGDMGKTNSELLISGSRQAFVDEIIAQSTHVARKTFRLPRVPQQQRALADSIWNEVDIMRRLNHPHVVKFIGVSLRGNYFSIFMLPVAQSNLQIFVDQQELPITDNTLMQIVETLQSTSDAIAYLHDSGIRHRDIKPANILISSGRLILSDFGISVFDKPDKESASSARDLEAFTRRYAAPEVFVNGSEMASDIYSLGCVYLEMVTILHNRTVKSLNEYLFRETPADSHSYHRQDTRVQEWLCRLASEKPLALAEAMPDYIITISKMLDVDPKKRPNAAELRRAFRAPLAYGSTSNYPKRAMSSLLRDLPSSTRHYNDSISIIDETSVLLSVTRDKPPSVNKSRLSLVLFYQVVFVCWPSTRSREKTCKVFVLSGSSIHSAFMLHLTLWHFYSLALDDPTGLIVFLHGPWNIFPGAAECDWPLSVHSGKSQPYSFKDFCTPRSRHFACKGSKTLTTTNTSTTKDSPSMCYARNQASSLKNLSNISYYRFNFTALRIKLIGFNSRLLEHSIPMNGPFNAQSQVFTESLDSMFFHNFEPSLTGKSSNTKLIAGATLATHQSRSNSSIGHNKHLREDGDGIGDDEYPDHFKKAKTDKWSERRFICPFYAYDSQYFRTSIEHGNRYMTCAAGIGFLDIPRLKEHLYRVHSPEILCVRCGTKFAEQDDLETHWKHEDGPECPNNILPPPRSMTASMKRKLSVKGKRDKSTSKEDKWFDIYKLLFPNERRPTTSPYRQDVSQPTAPCQDKQILDHFSEHDLIGLLKPRVDMQLGYMLLDSNSREQMKKIVMSELAICIEQFSTDLPETPMSFDDSNAPRNAQSGESSTDSGYGSRCGNIDCMGNCHVCEQLASPFPCPSQQQFQEVGSPYFDPEDQYLNPSVLMNPEAAGRLQSTEHMDELLEHDFPTAYTYTGNPYLGLDFRGHYRKRR